MTEKGVDLSLFDNSWFRRGRPRLFEALWMLADALFVRSSLPGSMHRRVILRYFGAKIGRGVAIKPGVRIKFPWRLAIGDNAWIGENAWFDNLGFIKIEANVCISQGAYLCTGNHDWSSTAFSLIVRPITIRAGAWIAARAVVGPGVTAGEGSILTLNSLATGDLAPWTIHSGVPAKAIGKRVIAGADTKVSAILPLGITPTSQNSLPPLPLHAG